MTIPTSTYRLQLCEGFGFDQARELLDYLSGLGISHVYLSPIFAARSGSTHGYDGVDPTRISEVLGGDEAFDRLADAAAERGLGLLVDLVPNHLAATPENPWWRDLLTHGPASRFADYFDIDWDAPWPGADERVLVPVLGAHYHEVVCSGELQARFDAEGERGFEIAYYEHLFPLDPHTVATLLALGGEACAEVGRFFEAVPPRRRGGDADARHHAAMSAYTRLEAARGADPRIDEGIARALTTLNDVEREPRHLDRLASAQAYRLSDWRMARHEINYRRFFNISDLVGMRIEEPAVRAATHRRFLQLWDEGRIDAVRIDHIDGLRAPGDYLRWLHERLRATRYDDEGAQEEPYIVVEKILARSEILRGWPVAGTTGYVFANRVNGLFVDPAGLEELDRIYEETTGRQLPFDDLLYEKKRQVTTDLFEADFRRLAWSLAGVARGDFHGRDVAEAELQQALVEVSACLPVYRTYSAEGVIDEADRAYIGEAVDDARRRNPEVDAAAYEVVGRVLQLRVDAEVMAEARDFVERWQQFTPPVTAKGLEDTTLYVYNRLIGLNTVGGEPDDALVSPAQLHAFFEERCARWPHAMSASSTHDSKRGEDVRARLDALSELAGTWRDHVERWQAMAAPRAVEVAGELVPDPNEAMLLYQTLLGAWPITEPGGAPDPDDFAERLATNLRKSAREAKEFTSWQRPDVEREEALVSFARGLIDPADDSGFLESMRALQERLARVGVVNSLAQVVIKASAPGVPDIYQGSEGWNLSMVDPDNRRPVDYARRREQLAGLQPRPSAATARGLLDDWRSGAIKMHVLRAGLQLRLARPELFQRGSYIPLKVVGARADRIFAFARRHEGGWVVAVVPRLVAPLFDGEGESKTPWPTGVVWAGDDTRVRLPPEAPKLWESVLTDDRLRGGEVAVGELFAALPVALLESD